MTTRPDPKATAAAWEQIRAMYDSLPEIDCRGLCANACGPIDMSDLERSRLVDLGVDIPVFTSQDARAWAAGARLDCPALTPMRTCRVYADRPLICRMWGVAESMPCEWGCTPRRMLTDDEAYDLIFRVNEIGGHHQFGNGDELRNQWAKLREDPDIAHLFARFIRGETHVEEEIWEALKAQELRASGTDRPAGPVPPRVRARDKRKGRPSKKRRRR